MVQIECGCEVSDDKTRVLSLCSLHAVHEHVRLQTMEHHPRAREQVAAQDRDYERELVRILAPVVFSRTPSNMALDPETCAEKLFQCVNAITKRLE